MRSILVFFFDRFYHCYHSFITMSNINSSDSDATVSYGNESDFDGFTIERASGATAAVGKATASTSGTRRVDAPDDSDSDTDDYYAELSSSSSAEVWIYSFICVI